MKPITYLTLIVCITPLIFFLFQANITAFFAGFPQPKFSVVVDKDQVVHTPDGTELVTDVYRPEKPGKYPVIVIRTPYDKESASHMYPLLAKSFASQGYVCAVQDVRGRNKSGGIFTPYENEALDGDTTVTWAAEAKWSNGEVTLFGFSYLGSCAWLAATKNNPHLKAVIPLFISQNTYKSWFHQGVPHLKDMLYWIATYQTHLTEDIDHDKIDRVLTELSVIDLDKKLVQKPLTTYQSYLAHKTPGPFWDKISAHNKVAADLPTLLYGAWFDRAVQNALDVFEEAKAKNSPLKLVIGPWVHTPTDPPGDLSFDKNAKFSRQFKEILHWMEEGKKAEPSISYYVMGKNTWEQTTAWPPVDTEFQSLYLSENALTESAGNTDQILEYNYDPENPTPSIGTHLVYGNGLEGAKKLNELFQREDVVTFSTEALKEDTEVTGPLKVILHISSSAVDTDFSLKLADIHPDGDAYFIQSGFLRMRYRNSLDAPELMVPEKIYEVQISMSSTSYQFKKGHRIGLLVSSSDFPNYSRNLNTEEVPEEATTPIVAKQKIHCGKKTPSRLVLPLKKPPVVEKN